MESESSVRDTLYLCIEWWVVFMRRYLLCTLHWKYQYMVVENREGGI